MLPYVTPDLPGIGGEIKRSPADFVVEEVPLYEPTDAGEHVYVRVTREGMATRDLVLGVCGLFAIPEVDVGYAGMKDKQARATQTISLRLPAADPAEVARRIAAELPVEVAWARRHVNKLRKGHLLGNRFRVAVRATAPVAEAETRARAILSALATTGLPNYYGEQRFGRDGDNVQRGRQVLDGRGPRQRWLRDLLLSAWQSHLFNEWLAARIRDGRFAQLIAGDIARKSDTGGIFDVADIEAERPRFERDEISYTGPIYGSRMRWATGEAGDRERAVFAATGVTEDMLRRARLDGSRRLARIRPFAAEVAAEGDGLTFAFTLPKGAYATVLLRELRKSDVVHTESDSDDE